MWILPKQLHTSAFVQDTKESGLDLEEFCRTCEKSLSWRGKDSLSRTWLQRWKRESWMRHLSSRTLNNSLTESFVDKWTSYLADSRANPSVVQDNVKQLMTLDTCSHTSEMESGTANLELFSSKMLEESSQPRQGTENQFSNMSSENWKDWVTEQRQEYSQRKKSAHLTRESEYSSLGWPTASVSDPEGGSQANRVEWTESGAKLRKKDKPHMTYGAKLRDAVENHEKNWATPQTFDSNNLVRTPEKLAQTRAEKNAGCMNLREQVHYPDMDHSRKAAKNWPTIQASEPRQGYQDRTRGKKGNQKSLTTVVMDGHLDRANLNTSGRSQESQKWPTPRANKVHPQITEENREHLANRKKSNLEEDIAGHCGKATGKLNPNWVEHLMGLPVGWTQLPTEWIDSDC